MLVYPQPYGIKARNFLSWINFNISCFSQTCFTLDTNRRCLQTARPQSKIPDQHLTSQSYRNFEHWYSCRQRMIYMYVWWSAWTRDIFQRFSSSWSPRTFSHAPTSGIFRSSCLSHSLLCIFSRTCVILMSVRYLCHFMYCTDHYWKKITYW